MADFCGSRKEVRNSTSALRCVTEGTLLQWSALVWVTEFRSSAQNWKTEICGNCGSKTKYVKKYKYCFFYFYSHISTTKVGKHERSLIFTFFPIQLQTGKNWNINKKQEQNKSALEFVNKMSWKKLERHCLWILWVWLNKQA